MDRDGCRKDILKVIESRRREERALRDRCTYVKTVLRLRVKFCGKWGRTTKNTTLLRWAPQKAPGAKQ